jgi:hypothetical protein
MEGKCGESENSVIFEMGLERERECSCRRKGEFGKNGDERLMGEYDHGRLWSGKAPTMKLITHKQELRKE